MPEIIRRHRVRVSQSWTGYWSEIDLDLAAQDDGQLFVAGTCYIEGDTAKRFDAVHLSVSRVEDLEQLMLVVENALHGARRRQEEKRQAEEAARAKAAAEREQAVATALDMPRPAPAPSFLLNGGNDA